jgi:hypothetical protein
MLLTSVGDFLTGAFADDEETSASYFSRELLDQLSDNDPTITGIWLQSKNLHDGDIKVLCDNLMRNTNVTEVWLPGNFITDEGAKSIAHMLKFNKSIKELFLGQNDIGPRGAAVILPWWRGGWGRLGWVWREQGRLRRRYGTIMC